MLDHLGETFIAVASGYQAGLNLHVRVALPIAMLRPLLRNIRTSFGMSPSVRSHWSGPRAVLTVS